MILSLLTFGIIIFLILSIILAICYIKTRKDIFIYLFVCCLVISIFLYIKFSKTSSTASSVTEMPKDFLTKVLNANLNKKYIQKALMSESNTSIENTPTPTSKPISPESSSQSAQSPEEVAIELINKITNKLCGKNSKVKTKEDLYGIFLSDTSVGIMLGLHFGIIDSKKEEDKQEYEDLFCSFIVQGTFMNIKLAKEKDPTIKDPILDFDGKNIQLNMDDPMYSVPPKTEKQILAINTFKELKGKVPKEQYRKLLSDMIIESMTKDQTIEQLKSNLTKVCTDNKLFI